MFTPFPAKDGKPKRAYIFESAIDLMSFYTFCDKRKLTGAVFVSMAGVKPTVPKKLQEQGVGLSPVWIMMMQEENLKRKIILNVPKM